MTRATTGETVLVTGAAGYLGSHAVVGLTRAGYRVVGVDNYLTSNPAVVDAIEEILGHRPTIHEADVADEQALRAVFASEPIDAVIHFAGLKSVGDSVLDPLLYYRVNLQSATTLFSVMREHDVRRIIFSSSCTVYGNPTIRAGGRDGADRPDLPLRRDQGHDRGSAPGPGPLRASLQEKHLTN